MLASHVHTLLREAMPAPHTAGVYAELSALHRVWLWLLRGKTLRDGELTINQQGPFLFQLGLTLLFGGAAAGLVVVLTERDWTAETVLTAALAWMASQVRYRFGKLGRKGHQ
jgi:hypothetical protein